MLYKYPFLRVDAEAIAKGFIAMWEPEDRILLRFGMLPAKWMDVLEKMLRESLTEKLRFRDCENGSVNVYYTPDVDDAPYGEVLIPGELAVCREVDFDQMHKDVLHEITLRLYDQVEMLV